MRRIAAGVAILVGLMSMVVGTLTLLGLKPATYVTLDWLLIYNVALGAVSIGVGVAIFTRRERSLTLALAVLASHVTVLAVVTVLWLSSVAAAQSVGAMIFRSVVWSLISAAVWRGRSRSASPPLSPSGSR